MPQTGPGAGPEGEVGHIRSAGEFDAVAGQWSTLATRAPSAHVFQSHAWLSTWLGHHPGGHPDIVYAHRGGVLTAALPLCAYTLGWGALSLRVLRFAADIDSDYCDALCDPQAPEDLAVVWRVLLASDDWELLDLRYVPEGSHLRRVLAAESKHLLIDRQQQDVAPYLDLATDWREALPREQRDAILRRMRRLHARGSVSFEVAASPGEVEGMLGQLAAIHVARWEARGQTSVFCFRHYREWIGALALRLFEAGQLYLCRLALDGDPVSMGIYFLDGRRLHGYLTALSLRHMEFGPGHLLEAYVLDDVRGRGLADVDDFGRGGEEYKLRWSRRVRTLDRFLVARPSAAGRAAFWWAAQVQPFLWRHHELGTMARELRRRLALRRRG